MLFFNKYNSKRINKLIHIYILFFFLTFFNVNQTFSQTIEEIESMKDMFFFAPSETYSLEKNYNSEFDLMLDILFVWYKNLISPFDFQRCSFYPSCSVYAVNSIKKNGFLIGFLDALDRLSRCNGLSPENYEKYEAGKLLYDPVK